MEPILSASTQDTAANAWTGLANTINTLISANPLQGLLVIMLTTSLFIGLLVTSAWAIVKILKANKQTLEIVSPPSDNSSNRAYTTAVVELVRDISMYNKWRDELSRRHERIAEITTVRDQMNYLDTAIDGIRAEILSRAAPTLSNMSISGYDNSSQLYPQDHPLYRAVERAVSAAMQEIRILLRRVCKENHLASHSDAEFELYIKEKFDQIRNLGHQIFMGAFYLPQKAYEQFSREYEIIIWEDVYPSIARGLQVIRKIAITYQQSIEDEENEYEKSWAEFLASIPQRLAGGTIA